MIELLRKAISARTPIRFQYNKPDKAIGVRIGNPHALFIMNKKDGTQSTKVHIVQTGGVSDSEKPFPSFRMFDISELSDIQILENEGQFEISSEYNPLWEGYAFVIEKV